jgi:hypothetical protein
LKAIAGIIVQLLLLGAGVYLYLFAIGAVSAKNPAFREQSEAFRRENSRWLRVLSLALMAIMFVNVLLSLRDLLA